MTKKSIFSIFVCFVQICVFFAQLHIQLQSCEELHQQLLVYVDLGHM